MEKKRRKIEKGKVENWNGRGKSYKMRKNDFAPSDKYSSYEGQIENLGYKFGLCGFAIGW